MQLAGDPETRSGFWYHTHGVTGKRQNILVSKSILSHCAQEPIAVHAQTLTDAPHAQTQGRFWQFRFMSCVHLQLHAAFADLGLPEMLA